MNSPKTKVCRICNTEKPIEEFRLNKDTRNGKVYVYRKYLCIDCQTKRDNKYREENKSALAVTAKKYYQEHYVKSTRIKLAESELRDRNRQRSRDLYKTHPEKWKNYFKENKDEIYIRLKSTRKAWGKNNQNKLKCYRKKTKLRGIAKISNTYVKHLINKAFGISWGSIPDDLIMSYAMQIKVKRLLKTMKNENTKTS